MAPSRAHFLFPALCREKNENIHECRVWFHSLDNADATFGYVNRALHQNTNKNDLWCCPHRCSFQFKPVGARRLDVLPASEAWTAPSLIAHSAIPQRQTDPYAAQTRTSRMLRKYAHHPWTSLSRTYGRDDDESDNKYTSVKSVTSLFISYYLGMASRAAIASEGRRCNGVVHF